MTDDGFAVDAEQPGGRRVDELVAALEVLDEDAVGGALDDRLEQPLPAVNAAAARLLGIDRGAVIGHADDELFGSDASAARRARDQAVLATGETRRYWRTITSRQCATAPSSSVKTPFRDRSGTDRRPDRHRPRRDGDPAASRRRPPSFFDLAPDMLCTAGADGRLERVNDAWTAGLAGPRRSCARAG